MRGKNSVIFFLDVENLQCCKMSDEEKKQECLAKLTKDDLIKKCEELGLSTSGNKPDLYDRWQEFVKGGNDDDDGSSVKTAIDGTPTAEDKKHNGPVLTFRDFEETIQPFTGREGEDVQRWLEEFENIAIMLNWNDQFRFVYGKRLVKGMAFKFIDWQRVRTWIQLRAMLMAEFSVAVSSKSVHDKLRLRKKKADESYMEYVYDMVNIARPIALDEMATIEYIIGGIDDDERNKVVLYEATSIKELKARFLIYEKMRAAIKLKEKRLPTFQQGATANHSANNKNVVKSKKPLVCFNCNEPGHISKDCPTASKGVKCLKCNQLGHIKKDCPSASVLCARASYSHIDVEFKNITLSAVFDSGAERSLIRESVFDKIGKPKLQVSSLVFTGLGGSEVKSRGYFDESVKIQNDEYNIRFHVVPKQSIPTDVILGENLLDVAETNISKSGLKVTKYVNSDENNEVKVTKDRSEDEEHARKILSISINDELDVDGKFAAVVNDLVVNYKPNPVVKTTIATKIIVTDDVPIYERARRLAPLEKRVLNEQIDEWLREGVIRPSRSDYASAVVMVRKKDGSYRVCVDYRRLNKKVVKDRFPLPLIEDQIDVLAGARIFSTIDMKNGFFHIPVEESSRKYTAFITPDGLFEFNKTPFGLCNSPASFGRFVRDAFKDLNREGILMHYMDDVIIPAADESEGLERLKRFLAVAEKYGININWKKCQFLKRRVDFLGHIIENSQVSPSKEKIRAVMDFPEPKTVKQIQGFLGLTGFFRKYIEFYAQIAAPAANKFAEKGRRFQF